MASVCFFALFAAILIKISGEISPKFRFLLLGGCGVCMMVVFIRFSAPVLNTLTTLFDTEALGESFRVMMKALGIAFLVAISASFCRDLGENSIAEKVELCGKTAILALSIPVLTEILKFIGELAS